MQFLCVKGWRQFQHYMKRNPPWIKVPNSLLDDSTFAALPDTAKAHLIAIWLLASRTENRFPADTDFISRRINATSPLDLELLISKGFLEESDDASALKPPETVLLAHSDSLACTPETVLLAHSDSLASTPETVLLAHSDSLACISRAEQRQSRAEDAVEASDALSLKNKSMSAHPALATFTAMAESTFTQQLGSRPSWSAKDYVSISRLMQTHLEIPGEEFEARWNRYLADREPFIKKQGYGLAFFCSKFDSYIASNKPGVRGRARLF